jgi:predicted Zn-dependent protease with MMP-like domain
MPGNWKHLLAVAQEEVGATLNGLPADLQTAAREVPVAFEPRPSAELVADGIEPDTLGLFQGEAYPDAESGGVMPPQITLYLENLWSFANAEPDIYREELRVTFLHELGHYLGLDEADLEDRGLE